MVRDDSEIPLLPAHAWKTSYRHEEDDLVEGFYVPVLSCAIAYDRMTGYFTADALALASRGIERLIHNGGRMRLLVGCTLSPQEIQETERSYELREKISNKLQEADLTPPDLKARHGLEALGWLIAHDRLDLKVAVPVEPSGKPASIHGIYHEKVGVITDSEGNRISFSGSINETAGGWINNRESFHVHCSWEGGREFKHVEDEVEAFSKLWEGRSEWTLVLDFPEAVKKRLLEFLPREDRFVAPPRPRREKEEADGEPEKPPHALYPEEVRRVVWSYIRHAPRLWNGIRVGEVTSAVKPWPHQVRTYKRLLEGWPYQVLLADEVGLGKTITAGLVIRQAWLSGLARRILLLVPRGLLSQWQSELCEKFNLNVPIYDGKRLVWKRTHGFQGPHEKKAGRTEWHREPFVLASSQLLRRGDRAADLMGAEDWDLLVLDEAHHARRKAPGTPQEGGPNQLLRLLEDLRPKVKSLLFLTATPMQVHPVELWDLLRLLGLPAHWAEDRNVFLRYFGLARGNPSQADMEFLAERFQEVEAEYGKIDEEEVEKLVEEAGKIGRRRIIKALRERSGIPLKRLDSSERQAALEILRRFSPIRHRMIRNTRSLLREYHRRGLLDRPIPRREVSDIAVEMTPSERDLYEAVEDYISTTYKKATQEKRSAVGFVMTIYRRRLASSFFALQRTLNKRLEKLGHSADCTEIDEEDVSQDETADEVMDASEASALAQEALSVEEHLSIRDLLKRIARVGANTKARRLLEDLRAAFTDGHDSAIIFTQYTDTMDFLKEELAAAFPDMPIACYSGRGQGGEVRDIGGYWTPKTKEEVKRLLKGKKIRLLVCTDAAAEGLNLQYCGLLVNYDLPWNPMKVEQRIGRIDRIGQAHEVVRVINLAYKDTVEADVYFALGQRINLFEGLVGKLQPILSRLPKGFETVALEPKESREAARQRFLADLGKMVDEADKAGLDIDEVAQEALAMPEMPPPALTSEEIDQALNRPEVRPPGSEWRPLDPGSYALKLPGFKELVRVTTDAEVFEDHFESHEFLSPGGRLFEMLAPEVPEEKGATSESEAQGHVWLRKSDVGEVEVVAVTRSGELKVSNLKELLSALEDLKEPAKPASDRSSTCLG